MAKSLRSSWKKLRPISWSQFQTWRCRPPRAHSWRPMLPWTSWNFQVRYWRCCAPGCHPREPVLANKTNLSLLKDLTQISQVSQGPHCFLTVSIVGELFCIKILEQCPIREILDSQLLHFLWIYDRQFTAPAGRIWGLHLKRELSAERECQLLWAPRGILDHKVKLRFYIKIIELHI